MTVTKAHPSTHASALTQHLQKATRDGSLSGTEVKALVAEAKQGGLSRAEAESLRRGFGHALNQDTHRTVKTPGETSTFVVGDQAKKEIQRFEAGAAGGLNARLPYIRANNAPNRLGMNPANPKHGFPFPVKAGTALVDGADGSPRGTVSGHVQINYGQRKVINGQNYVYAFDATMKPTGAKPGDKSVASSGWIREDAVTGPKAHLVREMPQTDNPPQKDKLITVGGKRVADTRTIVGGHYDTHGKDVRVGIPKGGEGNLAPGDYMTRPGGVINLLSAVPGSGGVSTDTVKAGSHAFVLSDVKPRTIPLYVGDGHGHYHVDPNLKQEFVYGHIVGADGSRRYGWIASDALKSS